MGVLKLVKASAGSGKTFKLTSEYLSLSLKNPDKFKNILAITFTNKAAGEMKRRILSILHSLARGSENNYIEILKQNTKLEEKVIREKSDLLLKKILHNYSYFSVKTIDSFFQQIIRSFLFESGLFADYNLELNYTYVLNKAIDNLLLNIVEDKNIMKWLVKLADEKIGQSKSWNIRNDIIRLSDQLFKEELNLKFDKISEKLIDKNFLEEYISQLYSIVNSFETNVRTLGQQAMNLIRQNGFTVDDFKYKKSGVAGCFENLERGIIYDITEKERIIKALDDVDEWLSKTNNKSAELKHLIENSLLQILNEIYYYFSKKYTKYFTAKILIGKIYVLGILNDVKKYIYEYVRNNNLFLITDTSKFLYEIIDDFDAPFIYEKAGINFQHLLLDEFQDTSLLQWKNIKPLLVNSLSQGNECLIVGDVKQSLYRWRNSTWEILAILVEDELKNVEFRKELLDKNFRSSYNIVIFNNYLFSKLPEVIVNTKNNYNNIDNSVIENLKELYSQVRQVPYRENNRGYIKLKIINDELIEKDAENLISEEIVETIKMLLDNNYLPGEIAILTRTNNEAEKIAEVLIEFQAKNENHIYKFEIVSEEALTLASSRVINFIISVFNYIINGEKDFLNTYYLIREYLLLQNSYDENKFLSIDLKNSDQVKKILPPDFVNNIDTLRFKSIDIILDEVIDIFKLHKYKEEQLFLFSFKDLVHDYVLNKNNSLFSFLEFWEEIGKDQKISCPENKNAIRILTIHKAKGLEFNAVIIPFCDWKIDTPGNILWSTTNEAPFNNIDLLPVDYNKFLKKTVFSNIYDKERIYNIIDNLNLLYVAFTRPVDVLVCFMRQSRIDKNNYVSKWIYEAICINKDDEDDSCFSRFFNKDSGIFEFGEINKIEKVIIDNEYNAIDGNLIEDDKEIKKKKYEIIQENRYSDEEFPEYSRRFKGVILHQILSGIKTLNDIDKEVKRVFYEGKITLKEYSELLIYLKRLFENPTIQEWYNGEWKLLNERSIIARGNIKRPDRIMIRKDEVVLIDYKSGRQLPSHESQLKDYVKILQNMEYKNIKAYLWYFLDNKLIEVC